MKAPISQKQFTEGIKAARSDVNGSNKDKVEQAFRAKFKPTGKRYGPRISTHHHL